jgi:hypothetical protein
MLYCKKALPSSSSLYMDQVKFDVMTRKLTGACGNLLRGLKYRGYKKQLHINWMGKYINALKMDAFAYKNVADEESAV